MNFVSRLQNRMKLSVVIPILNSHKAVSRQIKHFNMMKLPDDIEFVFVDDGSNPPLDAKDYQLKNLRIMMTNDNNKNMLSAGFDAPNDTRAST